MLSTKLREQGQSGYPNVVNGISSTILLFVALSASAEQGPDLAAQVHGLLADRCISCHGPEKQKNGLRLDSRTGLLAGGDSGPAIVLSNGIASLIYSNVAGLNSDSIMPPKGERLTSNEVALIK